MITIISASISTTFLVAIRLGTLFIFSPIETIRLLPITIRLLLTLMVSMLIASHVGLSTATSSEALMVSGLAEFCNGLMLSLGLYAAFAVFHIAGQLIDTQMGLNALALLNPSDHSHEPLSARLLSMLALLYFFAIDGHHKLIQALVLSFKITTPGKAALFNGFKPIILQFSTMFSWALSMASPLLISLLLIELTAAILTRNMPQISSYFLSLPIKIMLGLLILSLMLNDVGFMTKKVFDASFQSVRSL